MPGLYYLLNQKSNGMIVKSLESKKTQFVSGRKYDFSPLETISIYSTEEEPLMLRDVLLKMKEEEEGGKAIVDPKGDKESLRNFFKEIAPSHDENQVYTSDIKKIVKWYNILKPLDLIHAREEEAVAEEDQAE